MVERTMKVHLHYEVLLSNTKESIIDTRDHLDESPENHAEWEKKKSQFQKGLTV